MIGIIQLLLRDLVLLKLLDLLDKHVVNDYLIVFLRLELLDLLYVTIMHLTHVSIQLCYSVLEMFLIVTVVLLILIAVIFNELNHLLFNSTQLFIDGT